MSSRVIGTAAAALLAAAVGCVPEYNEAPFHGETDALSHVVRLTRPDGPDGFARAGQARLSPDGQWVVFRGVPRGAPPGEEYGLFVAHVRWAAEPIAVPDHQYLTPLPQGPAPEVALGARYVAGLDRPVRVTRQGERAGGAWFSPDGFTLLLTAGQPSHMRLFRAEGWAQAVALTDVARGVDLAQHAISSPGLSVEDCAWSPNGRSIVVVTTSAADGRGPTELYSLRPDGTHPIRLGPIDARDPAFSPDGRRLAYRAGAPPQVDVGDVVLDVAGDVVGVRDVAELTHESNVAATGPCWLADGRRIAYATTLHGDANPELYLMRSADGRHKTRLTFSPGVDLLPAVTADGRSLVWTTARPPGAAPQLFAAQLALPPGS